MKMSDFQSYYNSAKRHFVASHQHPINQALHHANTLLALVSLVYLLIDWRVTLACLVITQIFAISGHFIFEKNKPAAVKYPGITILVSIAWSFEHWFGLRDVLQHYRGT
jgi:hypothetical protein